MARRIKMAVAMSIIAYCSSLIVGALAGLPVYNQPNLVLILVSNVMFEWGGMLFGMLFGVHGL